MKGVNSIDERAVILAQYIIDSKDTVRGTAKKFRDFKKYSSQRGNTSERFEIRTNYPTKYRN